MKSRIVLVAFSLGIGFADAQGTFVYDQQSSTEGNYQDGAADIQRNQPIGPSFIPQLSNVGFIRLFIYNGLLGNNSAATIYVNLRSDSIAGLVLSSTSPAAVGSGATSVGLAGADCRPAALSSKKTELS